MSFLEARYEITLFIIFSLAGAAFAADESTHMAGRGAKTPGHPGYIDVQDNDSAMDHAVAEAQKALGFFIAALQAKKNGDTDSRLRKVSWMAIKWSISGSII